MVYIIAVWILQKPGTRTSHSDGDSWHRDDRIVDRIKISWIGTPGWVEDGKTLVERMAGASCTRKNVV
jgi:hypothetical protein